LIHNLYEREREKQTKIKEANVVHTAKEKEKEEISSTAIHTKMETSRE